MLWYEGGARPFDKPFDRLRVSGGITLTSTLSLKGEGARLAPAFARAGSNLPPSRGKG